VSIARKAIVAAAAFSLVTTGCKGLRRSGPAPQVPDTVIEVENHGFPDIVLYAMSAGDPFRLGMVTGSGSAKFKLPGRFTTTGTLQLLARPIAGRSYLLPAVSVSPGDVIEVSLESTPAMTRVLVSPREP
jgi:hypothetical protein